MIIYFKQKEEKDNQFVYDLFFSHKIKELNGEAWPENIKQQICLIQFNAFEKSFVERGLDVKDLIIIIDSKPIGRLILNETEQCMLIGYIGVISDFQNKGIGKKVLNIIIEKAINNNKKLSLSVSIDNYAYYLYLKLGFIVTNKDEINYTMTYTP